MSNIKLDQLFKAFADESRLRILSLLVRGELCVCDVMDVLKLPQAKVSRHLAYLRKCGLVETRRDGQWIYYALGKPGGPFHKRLLDCLDGCFDEAPIFKRDAKALQAITKKNNACC